jgi:hypothetical protein
MDRYLEPSTDKPPTDEPCPTCGKRYQFDAALGIWYTTCMHGFVPDTDTADLDTEPAYPAAVPKQPN